MNGLPDFDIDRFTAYRLTVAAQKLSDAFATRYRKKFGLSVPEWRVLTHLARTGNVSVRDIEARAAMEKSKVSRAASRLEKAGYIAKRINGADRRLVQLALTEKGEELMVQLLPLANTFQNEVEALLGSSFDGLEAGIEKLLES